MIYTAENKALPLAEIVVHLSADVLPLDHAMLKIKISNNVKFDEITTNELEPDWNAFPHKLSTEKIGDQFIQSRKDFILKVPSTVVHGDFNILINPIHEKMKQIKTVDIQSLPLDKRLFWKVTSLSR